MEWDNVLFNPQQYQGGSRPPADPRFLSLNQQNFLPPIRSYSPYSYNGFDPSGNPLVNMGGMMAGSYIASALFGPGAIATNPFGSIQGGAYALRETQLQRQGFSASVAAGTEFNVAHMTGAIGGLRAMMNGGTMTAELAAESREAGRFAGNMVSSPLGAMAMNTLGASLGLDIGSIVAPGIGAAASLYYGTRGVFSEGQMGMSGNQTASLFRDIASRATGAGGATNFSYTRGMNIGQYAQMSGALSSRGLFGGDGRVDEASQNEQMMIQMQEYAPLIQTMREITGGEGDANSLMGLAQKLTGAVGQRSGGEINEQMNRVREIAKMAGITMTAMADIVQGGQDMAQRAGLSRQVGATIATNSVLAATSGMAAQGTQSYAGKASFESIAAQHVEQSVGAAKSMNASSLGAFANLIDQFGNIANLKDGTDEEKLLYAAIKGEAHDSAKLHALINGPQGQEKLANVAISLGIDPKEANLRIRDQIYAQEGIMKYDGIVGSTVKTQRAELTDRLMATSGRRVDISGGRDITRDISEAALEPGSDSDVKARTIAKLEDRGVILTDADRKLVGDSVIRSRNDFNTMSNGVDKANRIRGALGNEEITSTLDANLTKAIGEVMTSQGDVGSQAQSFMIRATEFVKRGVGRSGMNEKDRNAAEMKDLKELLGITGGDLNTDTYKKAKDTLTGLYNDVTTTADPKASEEDRTAAYARLMAKKELFARETAKGDAPTLVERLSKEMANSDSEYNKKTIQIREDIEKAGGMEEYLKSQKEKTAAKPGSEGGKLEVTGLIKIVDNAGNAIINLLGAAGSKGSADGGKR